MSPPTPTPVVFVTMPWARPFAPNIALGIMKAVLTKARIASAVRSYNVEFIDWLIAHQTRFPDQVNRRVGLREYLRMAVDLFEVAMGDWIFSLPDLRADSAAVDAAYLEYARTLNLERAKHNKNVLNIATSGRTARATSTEDHSDDKITDDDFVIAAEMRRLAPAFVEHCVQDVLEQSPRVVGFTTMFQQNIPSLLLAKLLKERRPELKIVFGGANCEGPMGAALLTAYPWIDVVVRGEGEPVVVDLVRDLVEDHQVRRQPGLCIREGSEVTIVPMPGGRSIPMDEVPAPDYDDYFATLKKTGVGRHLKPHVYIPVETSRGCWWGEKAHCTFCGLNGSTMKFASKTSDLVFDEIVALSRRYQRLSFEAVDNIIDLDYMQSLLPRLRDAGYDITIFYEVKSNLKREQVRLMRDSGLTAIQPGIESLSTPILKLMRKGVTALQNIRLLKWIQEFDLTLEWNLISGFPNEPPAEYERMGKLLPSLWHLPPPGFTRLRMDRFSPYHKAPAELGLEITGPSPHTRILNPVSEEMALDLAYWFRYRYLDGRDPGTYTGMCEAAVNEWRERYVPLSRAPFSTLYYKRGPGFIEIYDARGCMSRTEHLFDGWRAGLYLACHAGATPETALRMLAREEGPAPTLNEATAFLRELVELRLAYEEGGRFLSLACAKNPEAALPTAGDEVAHRGPEDRVHLVSVA